MYRIFPVKALVYFASLLTVGVLWLVEVLTSAFGVEVRIMVIISAVWPIMVALSFNPIWRWLWAFTKRSSFLPDLNHHIFPDLNGQWDMLLESNWSRQEQLLAAATDGRRNFDPRTCHMDELAELITIPLTARIEQSWWSIKITVTNPAANTPIKESQTYIVIPRKRTDTERPSLCYFYDQTNDTDNQADDPMFSAAACLFYDLASDRLEGNFWTARQWRRAINTAGRMTLSR